MLQVPHLNVWSHGLCYEFPIFLFDSFVEKVGELTEMADLQASPQNFKSFPESRYATYVTVQQAFRPSGIIDEVKRYFSGTN